MADEENNTKKPVEPAAEASKAVTFETRKPTDDEQDLQRNVMELYQTRKRFAMILEALGMVTKFRGKDGLEAIRLNIDMRRTPLIMFVWKMATEVKNKRKEDAEDREWQASQRPKESVLAKEVRLYPSKK